MPSAHLVQVEVVLHDLKNRARSLADRSSSGIDVSVETGTLASDVGLLYDDAFAYARGMCSAGVLEGAFLRAMEREIAPAARLAAALAAGQCQHVDLVSLRDALVEQHEGHTNERGQRPRRESSAICTALSGALFVGGYCAGVSSLRRAIRNAADVLLVSHGCSVTFQILLGVPDGWRVPLRFRRTGSSRDVPLGLWLYLGVPPPPGPNGRVLVV